MSGQQPYRLKPDDNENIRWVIPSTRAMEIYGLGGIRMESTLFESRTQAEHPTTILLRIESGLNEFLKLHAERGRLLSMEEACGYLGIGTTEGYAKIRAHVRTIKHGRRILVPREELDNLIERAKRTGTLFE